MSVSKWSILPAEIVYARYARFLTHVILFIAFVSFVKVVASMLVSPIMGPVLGLTFGTQIMDWSLVKTSLAHECAALAGCVLIGAFGTCWERFSNIYFARVKIGVALTYIVFHFLSNNFVFTVTEGSTDANCRAISVVSAIISQGKRTPKPK